MKVAHVRKFLVAVATGLTQAVALGIAPAAYVPYVLLCLAVLGAYGVYAVPND